MNLIVASVVLCGSLAFVDNASAAVFRSTYTGDAFFNTGAEAYGKTNGSEYSFKAVFTYNTVVGIVTSDPLSERYTGPISVSIDIGGTKFLLDGSAASYVQREQTLPNQQFPFYQNFASDEIFTGPTVFSGDFVAAGVSFISPAPIALIPASVTTPFSASEGPLTLDNIGSFSFDGGAVTGMLESSLLVVSQVPLPATAPLFGAAVLALGVAGNAARRREAAAV